MFIGYDLEHAEDYYKMYNPKTNRYHITRDVKWLDSIYFKNARFYNTEDLLNLKAGKSDKNDNKKFRHFRMIKI